MSSHLKSTRSLRTPIRTLLLTSTTLMACHAAHAADMPMHQALPPPPPMMAFSWTGFYLGGQVGYSWGKDHAVEYLTANGAFTGFQWKYPANGVVGGGYAGYNYQIGPAVLGLEADLEGAGNKGGFYDPPGAGDTKISWQGSVRGRLGYAINRVLVYGTGGFSFADISHTYVEVATPISETTKELRTGWTVGGGLEFAVTNNILAKAEYRYTDYGKYRYDLQTSFPGLTGEQQPKLSTIRLGVAYKF